MKTIKLNNGEQMPQLGFGVYQIEPEDTKQAVLDAIKAGYRSIDTARAYRNEAESGAAINEAIKTGVVKRSDIFLTTKIFINDFSYDAAQQAIVDSLSFAQQDYFDLILLHMPYGDVYGAYKALSEAQRDGKVKNIGISNFYPAKFVEFINVIEKMELPIPQINQIEFNPFYQQEIAREWHKKYNVQIEAWGPLAEGEYGIFKNTLLTKIGKKYNKSVAQVVLRWIIQSEIIAVVKSIKPERMAQNIDTFDFKLTDSEMIEIKSLDTRITKWDHIDPKLVEFFYNYE